MRNLTRKMRNEVFRVLPRQIPRPSASPNTDKLQTVDFQQPVAVRYLKLVAKSEVNGQPFAAIAELDVLTDEP